MTTADSDRLEPRALDVVEEAVLLLKRAGLPAYGAYAAGTLGFLWSLLYFWAYMSRNALAGARLSEFSLLLSLSFVTMKCCHALFFRRLMEILEDAPITRPSAGLLAKTALAQCFLQPLALFAIPIALLLTLPYPFVSAFFQNAFWVKDNEGFAAWLMRSYRMARLWPKQNMFLHLFLMGASLGVLLNVFSALVTAPLLLKSLLGVETVFSRTPSAYMNSTFIMMALALSWALLDPVVKAIHAWRCFHGLSLHTGMDLKLALGRVGREEARTQEEKSAASRTQSIKGPREIKGPAAFSTLSALSALAAGVLALSASGNAWSNTQVTAQIQPAPHAAQPSPPRLDRAPGAINAKVRPIERITPERLDALLKEEIAESRYGWREPRGTGTEESPSWVILQLKQFLHWTARTLRKIETLWLKFEDWFNGLFRRTDNAKSGNDTAPPSPMPTRVLVIALCLVFLGGIAAFLLRRVGAAPQQTAAAVPSAPKAPDAAREDAKADDFPEEEWLRLMESLRAQGQNRLALRALFLAMLSLLARKGWITVARSKSNRDYQREVIARARRRPGAAESFRENCRVFDKVWYGSHEATDEDWDISQANFAKVKLDEA